MEKTSIPVAQTFTYMDEELGVNLSEKCRLDTMVTVVDTAHFWSNYSTGESLLDRQQGINEDDERDIVDLYEPTSKDMVNIAESDIFIYSGVGMEPFATIFKLFIIGGVPSS